MLELSLTGWNAWTPAARSLVSDCWVTAAGVWVHRVPIHLWPYLEVNSSWGKMERDLWTSVLLPEVYILVYKCIHKCVCAWMCFGINVRVEIMSSSVGGCISLTEIQTCVACVVQGHWPAEPTQAWDPGLTSEYMYGVRGNTDWEQNLDV